MWFVVYSYFFFFNRRLRLQRLGRDWIHPNLELVLVCNQINPSFSKLFAALGSGGGDGGDDGGGGSGACVCVAHGSRGKIKKERFCRESFRSVVMNEKRRREIKKDETMQATQLEGETETE